ncbi:hypothetical protein ACXN5S_12430 [Pseudoroseicyclus sp. H15]
MADYWPDFPRWSTAEMYALAQSGVSKVDLLGPRGTTLCSMEEIEAMAAVLAISGAIPKPQDRMPAPPAPQQKET